MSRPIHVNHVENHSPSGAVEPVQRTEKKLNAEP